MANDYQSGDEFLMQVLQSFFIYDDVGMQNRQAMIQFLEIHIRALERHNQPIHLIDALKKFSEDTLNLSNIPSHTSRDSLRKQMAWNKKKPF